ncbi:nuclear GTPase SLIP-GC-like isoform X2 [Myxocyprinus asiaticus]|uniref:nuclear GTPase SLIP-GC-like isoform X2 n=1 Tax=Myxocyprinus asiaticus TaxID=70543 RepID=UPI00222313CE|nr:nuclear GTPase SLIP-GC-like isoform X2 [Myxocyprinus asiaticus]XP_051535464.1 nuclear GTPase SLIP-GC-like isoform X2 [Myxocyprinus asiaticus]XP_051535465.1 nuclear GTPase SLIP-GC-like isoform X2 [Myxocyprinus asiaticus]
MARGLKRKRDDGLKCSDSSERDSSQSPPQTDTKIIEVTKQILKWVEDEIRDKRKISYKCMTGDSLTEYIIEKISELKKVKKRKETIGVFGKSGAGKSALLSAILNKKGLLPSGDQHACTAVITQVEANMTDLKYKAEIEFFSEQEWSEDLENILQVLSDESEECDEELTENAKEKIICLFGKGAEKKTLEELKKDEKFDEVGKLLSEKKRFFSGDSTSITNFIKPFLTSRGNGILFWPVVKCVTIKVPNCHDFLEHIILVDLPGTGDCNKTRNNMWKEKLSSCSVVWIVSDITRALSNKETWEILKSCIHDITGGGQCERMAFICSKTDMIDPDEQEDNFSEHEQQYPEDENEKTRICIRKRNNITKKQVKEKFENSEFKKKFDADENFLQVFTVSSKEFFNKNSFLELRDTEIPELLDVLRKINSSCSRCSARDYVSKALGILCLIQSYQPDKNPDSEQMVETKGKLQKQFQDNLKKALADMHSHFDEILEKLDSCLTKGVDESMELCLKTACDEVISPPSKNNQWYHKTLEALCKHRGSYYSKTNEVDLNKCLANHMYNSIDEDFRKLIQSVLEQINKFSILNRDTLNPSQNTAEYYIQEFIKSEEANLKESLKEQTVKRKKEMHSSIKTVIQNALTSSYDRAAKEKGKGSMKRRQEILKEAIKSSKQKMFNDAKKGMLDMFADLQREIRKTLKCESTKSMDHSLQMSHENTLPDVSRYIDDLKRLEEELSDVIEQDEDEQITIYD